MGIDDDSNGGRGERGFSRVLPPLGSPGTRSPNAKDNAPAAGDAGDVRSPGGPDLRAGIAPPKDVPAPGAIELPTASFAAIQPPSLSLPKGGGALRGIGETFRTNPATGTAGLDIPLPITPAPHGPTPQLAISYDSGSGQGPFGLGFQLSIPQITRKTDKKLPEYRDSAESDAFLLSGCEELVPALRDDGLRDAFTDPVTQESVERFRPRTEGLFSRIERRTSATGDVRWQATTRDNTTSSFGTTPASRIADPQNARKIFSWLLDKTVDDRGHIVLYEYIGEDRVNAPRGVPSERNRSSGLAPITNRYIKRIKYGNDVPAGTTGAETSTHFELVFDYGDHPTEPPTPTRDPNAWPSRLDPFSSYRAGFEVRTYRLCHRVLMFHSFPELPGSPVLVRALELKYSPDAGITKLRSATLRGYDGASTATLPPLVLTFSDAPFSQSIKDLQEADVQPEYPRQAIGRSAQWVDLDGEGIPGILIDRHGSLEYQRNLGAGKLAKPKKLSQAPAMVEVGGATQITNVAGPGTMSVLTWRGPVVGYQERRTAPEIDTWAPFVPFPSQPVVSWGDPNLRLVDLNGDGFDDILITKGDHLLWYPSLGRDGFGPAKRVPIPQDIERAPVVVFRNREVAVFLTDMSGDGLADLVQVSWARILYWPNLGFGRFGACCHMDRSPKLQNRDSFHPGRVRLADLDGTGTADLLYFDERGLHIWKNEAGNGFTAELANPNVPPYAIRDLQILDLFGTGTSTLAWSPSGTPTNEPALRYTEPFGREKSHILAVVDNSMGKTVTMTYQSSTKSYLDDRKTGRRWATSLPFPVHVVTKVETVDAVSKTRFVSRYSYHHGHYDAVEREFRGFAFVEQQDAESFSPDTGTGGFPAPRIDPATGEALQAPVLTKTWFHTGAWSNQGLVDDIIAKDFWRGDPGAPAPIKCIVDSGMTPEEAREATRALRGSVIRQEVYGLDGSIEAGKPFVVSEHSYLARRLQEKQAPKDANRALGFGVFHTVPQESRSFHYERSIDPRFMQSLVLAFDPKYGNVTRSAVVAHPRRTANQDPGLPEQNIGRIVVAENDVVHLDAVSTGYRLGVPVGTRVWELAGMTVGDAPLIIGGVNAAWSGATEIAYEEAPTTGLQKRRIDEVKIQYYDSTAIPAVLPMGSADVTAVAYQSFRRDLTDAILAEVFGSGVIPPSLLVGIGSEGAYVTPEGETGYWVPSGFSTPDPNSFYLPNSFTDPFGNITSLGYDDHKLLVTSVTSPLGNVVKTKIDYRVLAPSLVTDPNENRSEVAFDPLGRVTAMAVMGKDSETSGDNLQNPTVSYAYETDRFSNVGKPNRVHVLAREQHFSARTTTRFQESYVYTDGSGRVVMTKARVEPGAAFQRSGGVVVRDPNGVPIPATADPRWVGSGKIVLNNKGNPVKQYEPFFAPDSEYDEEDDLVQWGVTPLLTYDALGRPTRIDLPNGTYRRSTWDAWSTTSFDENDTVTESGNQWFAQAGLTPAESRARSVTAPHGNTPTRSYVDSLGRAFLVVADNGGGALFETRSTFDIQGQVTAVEDALGRTCQTNRFSMGGQLVRDTNIDSGTRVRLATVLGEPLRRWDPDAPARSFRYAYDELRRPTHLYTTLGTEPEKLLERRYYGEAIQTAAASNLRTRLFALFDGSGLVKSTLFDFKGNLLTSTRRFASVYSDVVDWSAIATETDPVAAEASSDAALLNTAGVNETFTMRSTYDALNRVTSSTSPDNQVDPTSVTLPTYNQTGLLQTVGVQIRGAATTAPFVTNIDYDALGRRTTISYANGTTTAYAYEPQTLRLATLVTSRGGTRLQDLLYTYDPVGNVVAIADAALPDLLFTHTVEDASTLYVYDPTYRLTSAAGRESAANASPPQTSEVPASLLVPDPNTGATARYTETYSYDPVANITQVTHVMVGRPAGSWTRLYDYADLSNNRLRSTGSPGDPPAPYGNRFTHDGRGNATSMSTPFLSVIDSSPFDQMMHANLGGGGDAYYVYASGRTRVRKVIDRKGGLIQERLYLGGYEIYRQYQTGTLNLERQTLHVMDGVRRIAMVETKTVDANPVFSPTPRTRYQLSNHLDSVAIETDESGNVFSYEEFFPYGGTAYRSGENGVDVSAKRYRYCGAERDDETGFYCMGARYYCPWLGRWTTADPLGLQAGINLYLYCRAGPITLSDPSGLDPFSWQGNGGWTGSPDAGLGWDMLLRGWAAHLEFALGGSSQAGGTEWTGPSFDTGIPGGVRSTLTFRLCPINPKSDFYGRVGADAGAGFVPFLDPGERFITGQTVGGFETSRGWAGAQLALELFPVVNRGVGLAAQFEFPNINIPNYPGGGSFALAGDARILNEGVAATRVGTFGGGPGFGFEATGQFSFTLGSGTNAGPKKPAKVEPEPVEETDTIESRGARWDERGLLDFSESKDLFPAGPGQKSIVEIEYTGSYDGDIAAANAEGGFKRTPKGYVWHHYDYNSGTNRGTLQLVAQEAHSVEHGGGVGLYRQATGRAYVPPGKGLAP